MIDWIGLGGRSGELGEKGGKEMVMRSCCGLAGWYLYSVKRVKKLDCLVN
jgi:hypothetical protein